jgi:hypothetical protein
MTTSSARDAKRLRFIAEQMIQESESIESDRMFSANGFSRSNISILHQQVRSLNLAWALAFTGRLKPGSTIAIVGGSFTGMMLACALAIANDVIVYIFEERESLLARFRDKTHRFISPNLNSRDLPPHFHPTISDPFVQTPIFRWKAGSASEVAHSWLSEFHKYEEKLPIFCFFNTKITRTDIEMGDSLSVKLRNYPNDPNTQVILVDLLIDATGFGIEGNPYDIPDYSYWSSGHRLIYDYVKPGEVVLLSGCGDSGIIELLHYAIKDFSHDTVGSYFPVGHGLEGHLSYQLENALFKDILFSGEIERYECKVISELCWYLDYRQYLDPLSPYYREIKNQDIISIHQIMDTWFSGYVHRLDPRIKLPTWEEIEEIVFNMSKCQQVMFSSHLAPHIADLASKEIEEFMAPIEVGKALELLPGSPREDITIILNGTTPTPFTLQTSPFNIWLLHMLINLPTVSYKQGRIRKVERRADLRYDVEFGDGSVCAYDRVVTRYGPSRISGDQRLIKKRQTSLERGDALLCHVTRIKTIPKQGDKTSRLMSVNVAAERILTRRSAVLRRRQFSKDSERLNKWVYVRWLRTPADVKQLFPYEHTQGWLVDRVKNRKHVSFHNELPAVSPW